jgi:hypothetical protein
MNNSIPGGTSRRGFFVGHMLMNKHALMDEHVKLELPSRRIQDDRQLFAAQLRAGRACRVGVKRILVNESELRSARSIESKMARHGRDN